LRINPGRIETKLGLNQTDFFKDLREIDSGENSQAAEGIGRANDFCRLAGMLRAHQFNQGDPKAFFDPVLRGAECRLFVLELLRQSGHEVWIARYRFRLQIAQRFLKDLAAEPGGAGKTVGPEVSGFAQLLRIADAGCQACQRFDQRDAQE
jgi:hypothetical protein